MIQESLRLKLNRLRQEYKSNDSTPFIDAIEVDLNRLVEQKEILKLPAFKAWAEAAERAMNDISALLMSDDSLLNDEGKRLFDKREHYRGMFKAFSLKPVDDAMKSLEDLIDSKIPK